MMALNVTEETVDCAFNSTTDFNSTSDYNNCMSNGSSLYDYDYYDEGEEGNSSAPAPALSKEFK